MRMFQALHKSYNDLFTDGQFDREKIIENGLVDPNYNTEQRLFLLESVYKMILNSNSINSFTKYYITDGTKTYEETVNKYNKNHADDVVNLSSGKNRITDGQSKIKNCFPVIKYNKVELNFITWLLYDAAHMGLDSDTEKQELRAEFMRQYNSFRDKYGEPIQVSKRDVVINIPTYDKVSGLTDEEFNQFMELIQPYSRYVIQQTQDKIDSMVNAVGYFRYLMSKTSQLSELDIERKNKVLAWLGKGITEYENTVMDSSTTAADKIDNSNSDNTADNLDEHTKTKGVEHSSDISSVFKFNN